MIAYSGVTSLPSVDDIARSDAMSLRRVLITLHKVLLRLCQVLITLHNVLRCL